MSVALDRLIRPGGGEIAGTVDPLALQAAVTAMARAVHRRGGGDWLIRERDPFDFAAALYGTVLGGGNALLLPDDSPATADAMDATGPRRLGTGGLDVGTLVAEGGSGDVPGTEPGNVVTLTSASSGARKRLTRRLEDLLDEARWLDKQWPFGAAHITASMVSSHHAYGLMFAVVWPLARGSRVLAAHLGPVPDFASLEVHDPEAVVLVTSPSYLHRMQSSLAMARFEDRRRMPVRVAHVFSAGAPLDSAAARFAAAHLGCAVHDVYGSTETGAVATRRADRKEPWQALAGVTLALRDDRLVIRTPYAAVETPVPYLSADRARARGNGFELLGRIDRIVKVEGRRVSLGAVERAVRSVDWVEDCAATVGPDGRIAVAAVLAETGVRRLRTRGKPSLDAALRALLENELETTALPRRVRYLGRLPRDSQGKLRGEALAVAFAADARTRPSVHRETRQEDSRLFELVLDPDLTVFEGHFPNAPIVPGVALVHWAMRLAGAMDPVARMAVSRLEDVKFMNILAPGDEPALSLRHQPDRLEFVYQRGTMQFAKGRIVLDDPSA